MTEANKQAEFILVWTDDDEGAVPIRDQYRNLGHKVSIRDARFFAPNSVEPANRLVFIGAGKRDEIIAVYRSEHYRREWGDIDITDVPLGKMGEAVSVPRLARAEAAAGAAGAENEPDALDAQTAAMSDDDLRKFVKGITGKMPKQTATREIMMKALRSHQSGKPEAVSAEVEPVEPNLAPAPVSDANAAPPADVSRSASEGDI